METYKITFYDERNCCNECYKSAEDLHTIVSYLDAYKWHYTSIIRIERVYNDSKLNSVQTV